MCALSTLIRVVVGFFSRLKSLSTMIMDAFVVFEYELYFGFERNVKEPFSPSSILDILETFEHFPRLQALNVEYPTSELIIRLSKAGSFVTAQPEDHFSYTFENR